MWVQEYWPTEYWPKEYWSKIGMITEGFAIERKQEPGGSFSEIDRVPLAQLVFTDTGLAASTTYTYRVRRFGLLGFSDYSNEDNATTDP